MALTDLIIDEEELDIDLLEKTLKFDIGISKNDGKVLFIRLPENQTIKEKILLYLLGRKASSLMRYWDIKEGATPSEIEEDINVAGDSLRPYLMKLYNQKYLKKEEGRYYVPNYKIKDVKELLKPDDDIPF